MIDEDEIEYEWVRASQVRVGDVARWNGTVTSIENNGAYLRIFTEECGSVGYASDDEVWIVARPPEPQITWLLSYYTAGGYDDGDWQQPIAAFEDAGDAMIYADNENDRDNEWVWVEFEGEFRGSVKGKIWAYFTITPLDLHWKD